MKIMLVEDDALVGQAMEAFLLLHGHEVVGPFASAAEVFLAVQHGAPDLVLMDVDLGNGRNGLDCARVLFKRYGIPVVFLSAHPDRAREGEGSALGYMTKPVAPEALLRGLKAAEEMARGRPSRPAPPGFTPFRRAPDQGHGAAH